MKLLKKFDEIEKNWFWKKHKRRRYLTQDQQIFREKNFLLTHLHFYLNLFVKANDSTFPHVMSSLSPLYDYFVVHYKFFQWDPKFTNSGPWNPIIDTWKKQNKCNSEDEKPFITTNSEYYINSPIHTWVILKKSPKLTVLKYWNKKLFLPKYFAGVINTDVLNIIFSLRYKSFSLGDRVKCF